jgi:hypothetical protein
MGNKFKNKNIVNTAVRSRFVRFAVAVRAVYGRGSRGLRSRFVQFAVAVRTVFSPTAD